MIREEVQSCGFKHGDVEHGVDRAHGVGKAEHEGMCTRMCNDFIWTEIFFGELLGWSSHPEELGFNKDLVTYCKLWSRELM
jgi:hypothetical protein